MRRCFFSFHIGFVRSEHRTLKFYFLPILFLTGISIYGYNAQQQYATDSLLTSSYRQLAAGFYEHEQDSSKAMKYAKAYLHKAKVEKNPIRMADGYFYHASLHTGVEAIRYADSIILYTKDTLTVYYPTLGYTIKAGRYYDMGETRKALDNYLQGQHYAKMAGNENIIASIAYSMGLLKNKIGFKEEGLKLIRECYDLYLARGWEEEYPDDFLTVMYSLTEVYLRNRILDSAKVMAKKGYMMAERREDTLSAAIFRMQKGVHSYLVEDYEAAETMLSTSLNTLKEGSFVLPSLSFYLFYLGKTQLALGKEDAAVVHLKAVDSLFVLQNDTYPEMRENYGLLIRHYEKDGNLQEHLVYVKKLLRFDSILNQNYGYLSNNIYKEYEIPNLESQKDMLEEALDKEKRRALWWGGILVILLLSSVTVGIFYYRRQRIYKRRFQELMERTGGQLPPEQGHHPPPEPVGQQKNIGISEDTVNIILRRLQNFEQSQGFLEQGITIHKLSEKFKTNHRYLSKVVNVHSGESFSNYLNRLRVDHAVRRLKEDSHLRSLMVSAIAEEMGFGNANSFSRAFYHRTGIYPSYFIRSLNKASEKGISPTSNS